jgi:hypothetical protein
MNEIA